MAKIKLVLTANPTFKAKVMIPVAGAPAVPVEFTFKHRSKEAFSDWLKNISDKEDPDLVLEVASGWELEDAFDRDNIALMCENYMGAARALIEKYISEQTAAKLGN
jgi:hypothetical protein